MGKLVSDAKWDAFRDLIKDAHDTFNQDTITWRRATKSVPRYFEDNIITSYTNIELQCLIGFNSFRTWPLTKHTESGELDEQNMYAMFSKDYLEELGYLNSEGYFNFKAGADLFIHRGILYKPEGDTFFSQAGSDPLHVVIVLSREELFTGDAGPTPLLSLLTLTQSPQDVTLGQPMVTMVATADAPCTFYLDGDTTGLILTVLTDRTAEITGTPTANTDAIIMALGTAGGSPKGKEVKITTTGIVVDPTPAGILDGLATAPAQVLFPAYKLRSAYAGSSCRIRRSSDNSELNIGFDGDGKMDTAALATFIGGGSGYLVTQFDQSGNGYDETQSTAGFQPLWNAVDEVFSYDGLDDFLKNNTGIGAAFNQMSVISVFSFKEYSFTDAAYSFGHNNNLGQTFIYNKLYSGATNVEQRSTIIFFNGSANQTSEIALSLNTWVTAIRMPTTNTIGCYQSGRLLNTIPYGTAPFSAPANHRTLTGARQTSNGSSTQQQANMDFYGKVTWKEDISDADFNTVSDALKLEYET